jgi:cysteine-rich repeat protein
VIDGDLDEEQCDDGNNKDGDGCSAICVVEECGDGILDPDGPDNIR